LAPYGFLGGSFDPVTKGHLALADGACREWGLERVYLVPARLSPLKEEGPVVSDNHRLAMLRLALRGHPSLRVGLWELDLPAPSYTYRTLRLLRRLYPGRPWVLILGADAWSQFGRWEKKDEILRHHTVVVGGRKGSGVEKAPVRLKTLLPEVSSTEVRDRISQGRSVTRQLPPGVGSYLERKKLYQGQSRVDPVWEKKATAVLTKELSPKRRAHVRAVALWAKELAVIHGAGPKQAYRAGLLHDLAKEWSDARLWKVLERRSIPGLAETQQKGSLGLFHGRVSADYAQSLGFITDRLTLNAMARHTLGHPQMSLLDKVVMVADYCSPDRRYREATPLRTLARHNLNGALKKVVQGKMEEALKKGISLHPQTVALWNSLV